LVSDDWSLRCTACGRCCNSGPELSVPELFRHQQRFIGRLAVRRVRRVESGAAARAAFDVLLVTHAWHDERLGRCPALADDGRCTLHAENKPLVCALAPLDALVPDAFQHRVLAQRAREAAYFGADCIVAGAPALAAHAARSGTSNTTTIPAVEHEPDGSIPLVRRLHVVEPAARRSLAARREALVLEKRFWGAAVFGLLESELFLNPAALAKIPPDGFASLSIAPVIMVVAEASARCRARCIEYLDAQLVLATRLGLEDVLRTHAALRTALSARDPSAPARPLADGTEAWLGITEAA
jgi:hypothetical protein